MLLLVVYSRRVCPGLLWTLPSGLYSWFAENDQMKSGCKLTMLTVCIKDRHSWWEWFLSHLLQPISFTFSNLSLIRAFAFQVLLEVDNVMAKCQQSYSRNIIVTTAVRCYWIFPSINNTSTWLQVRDYIHVVDLAEGHLFALRKLFESSYNTGLDKWLPSHIL